MATNDHWLSLVQEDTIEPDLPICDPHHHLWDHRYERVEPRYLLDEVLADINSGHNVVSTVFVQCTAMHKADGPEAMRPVGETEFVNGIAAMSASGAYGTSRVAAGIVGTVDLRLGDGVAPVLEAHVQAGGGRFRGIRHSAAWDAGRPPHLQSPDAAGAPVSRHQLPHRVCPSGPPRHDLRGLVLPSPDHRTHRPRARLSRNHDHSRPFRRPARRRPIRGQARGNHAAVAQGHQRVGDVRQRRRQARRHQHGSQRLRLARARAARPRRRN